MKIEDVSCRGCGAGFLRVELSTRRGTDKDYRCPVCDTVLEVFETDCLIAYRLTEHPLSLGHADQGVPA